LMAMATLTSPETILLLPAWSASPLRGQVTGDGRQVSDSGLASASRRELVNEKG